MQSKRGNRKEGRKKAKTAELTECELFFIGVMSEEINKKKGEKMPPGFKEPHLFGN